MVENTVMGRRELIVGTAAVAAASLAGIEGTQAAVASEAKVIPAAGEAEPTMWAFSSPDGYVPPAPVECEDKRATPLPEYIFGEPAGKLTGKIAVVTGASAGIGREIARTFAREGAKVVAVARRMERLQALSEESMDYAGEIVAFKADLSDIGQVEQMVNFALDTYGRIDILVNNAAIMGNWAKAETVDFGEFNYLMALNVNAPIAAMKYALPSMVEQGYGRIIMVNSMAGVDARSAGIDYVTSKHALRAAMQNTAFQYGNKGIRCNAVCPGGTETEVALVQPGIDDEAMEQVMAWYGGVNVPTQEQAMPEHVAALALYLACDEATCVNGAMFMHDNGRTMH